MNKTLIAIATAVIAATTMFASAAEAGMKLRIGFGFPIGGFHAHGGSSYGEHRRHRRHKYVKRRVKQKVHHAKKKSSSSTKVAKQEEAPKAEPVVKVETENSSITTAALPVEETPSAETPVEEKAEATTTEPGQETAAAEETKPATVQKASSKLDCKKFFPAVGMTLSVPCE